MNLVKLQIIVFIKEIVCYEKVPWQVYYCLVFSWCWNLIFHRLLVLYRVINFGQLLLGLSFQGRNCHCDLWLSGHSIPKDILMRFLVKFPLFFRDCILVALVSFDWSFLCHSKNGDGIFRSGIAPLLGGMNASGYTFHFTLVYFLLAFLIALNPSKILDRIGRILHRSLRFSFWSWSF